MGEEGTRPNTVLAVSMTLAASQVSCFSPYNLEATMRVLSVVSLVVLVGCAKPNLVGTGRVAWLESCKLVDEMPERAGEKPRKAIQCVQLDISLYDNNTATWKQASPDDKERESKGK